jgi:hypothetical protein
VQSLVYLTIFVALIGIFPSQGNGWRPLRVGYMGRITIIGDRHWSVVLGMAAFFSQWWAFQKKTQQSTTRLWLLAVTSIMATCFFSSAMAIAANRLFHPPRIVNNHNATRSRATLPLRSALVVALVCQVRGATLLSLSDGLLVVLLLFAPLLKRCGMMNVEPFKDDPVLFLLTSERSITVAEKLIFYTVRPVFTLTLNETWSSGFLEVLLALVMAAKWFGVHFCVVALAWLGRKSAPAILGRNGRNPMGMVFLCGWIFCLYLLIII